jgi:hypothetical protein
MYAVGLILGSLISSVLIVVFNNQYQYLFLLASAITTIGVTTLTWTLLPETKGIDILESQAQETA